MDDPSPIVEQSELVTDHFGYWPSFHDAEIERIELSTGDGAGPRIEVVVHGFEMTSDVDERGYFVLRKHCRVRLLFEGVRQVSLTGFDGQNSLLGLDIVDLRASQLEGLVAEVTFHGHGEGDLRFSCGKIAVLELAATDRSGHHPFGGGWGAPEERPARD